MSLQHHSDFSTNDIYGTISENLKNLNNLFNLENLRLDCNHLTGSIPEYIFNNSKLIVLSLSSNHRSGNLPASLSIVLPNIKSLYLSHNTLTSTIPSSISNASKLQHLELSSNLLSGSIPCELGKLEQLKVLNLENNSLNNNPLDTELTFITSLTNCRQLVYIEIGLNPLNGILPNSIGNLSTNLQAFTVGNSRLVGKIPHEIGYLSNLTVLDLSKNELSGPIPYTIGSLSTLQSLYLCKNNLKGTIPSELCNMRNLGDLFLDDNKLIGPIPNCFGKLSSLRNVGLGFNKLDSEIASSLWNLRDLVSLDLSSNSLIGHLPSQFGNLMVVMRLDLSNNQLSGNIPSTISGLEEVAYLSLSGNQFQGVIPESFGYMKGLEYLDLSYNNLSGEIPKKMESLINLKYLNLSFNQLQGEIPNEGPFLNFSAQSFMQNYELCGSSHFQVPPCDKNARKRLKLKRIPLTFVVPLIAVIVALMMVMYTILRWRRNRMKVQTQSKLPSAPTHKRIMYHELIRATNGFDDTNLIGKGSFGSVYKGILSTGLCVAIKVFDLQDERGLKSFDTECEILRGIRHRNLVRIISTCSNPSFKALILKYMSNDTLEKWLYSHNYSLDIAQRVQIMIDVASALEYLHHGCFIPVLHCDLKPSNVLLDEEMRAHVGDFGLSKLLFGIDMDKQTSTLATIGYMAPEYGSEGVISTRSDVYSFGILMIETFTRKKPTDEMFSGESNLRIWVNESSSIREIVDANLFAIDDDTHFQEIENCLSLIMALALECSANSPKERVDMKEAKVRLEKIKSKFLC